MDLIENGSKPTFPSAFVNQSLPWTFIKDYCGVCLFMEYGPIQFVQTVATLDSMHGLQIHILSSQLLSQTELSMEYQLFLNQQEVATATDTALQLCF